MAEVGMDQSVQLERLEEVVALASPLCPFMKDKDVFKRLDGPQTQGTTWVATMKQREWQEREIERLSELEDTETSRTNTTSTARRRKVKQGAVESLFAASAAVDTDRAMLSQNAYTYRFDEDKKRAVMMRNDKTNPANFPIKANAYTRHAEQLARDKKLSQAAGS